MDGTPDYITSMASLSEDWGKDASSPLESDSLAVPASIFPKGNKRKGTALDRTVNFNDGSSSLVLSLGLSSNSCTTICSGKEMEDESSLDLGLSINPNLGNKRSSSDLKKFSTGTSSAVKLQRPVLDLELSLSTGIAESDATTITEGLFPPQNVQPALAPTVQVVDEGSTSSGWRMGNPVPHSRTQPEFSFSFDKKQGNPTPNPNPVVTSSLNNQDQQRKTRVKTCQFEGCTRGARGASALCIAHGGGRRCQKSGCQKGAEGRTVFCKAHGGGRRCQHLGCTKSAEGRTDYCIAHGGGRRCGQEGCNRAARGRSGLCIRHGGGKRCKEMNCTKSAEGISGLCISHGGGRRCQYPECKKGAQGSTDFCKAHGGGRRCTFLGCVKGAEGSTPFCKAHGGGKRCTSEGCSKSVHGGTLFCVSHGGGKRCAMVECTKSARGRTSYCVRHGGGKRCKLEGCLKSAQGSTDFCKAHGGGKRCSWGENEAESEARCDKFARGKSGLCVAHSALVQDNENVGVSIQMNGGSTSDCGYERRVVMGKEGFVGGSVCLDQLSLPEGRVHGGGLMAMLRGGSFVMNNGSGEGSGF